MIEVELKQSTTKVDAEYSFQQLRDMLLREKACAFVGRPRTGGEDRLYIITYNCIVNAEQPMHVWNDFDAKFLVDRFLDIKITEL